MYIYFNESGNLSTTVYYNGEPVRQGNSFDVCICFPNSDEYLNLNPVISWEMTGGSDYPIYQALGVADDQSGLWGRKKKFFFKNSSDVSKYRGQNDLRDGQCYVMYHIRVPADSGVTANYGKMRFLVSVTDSTSTSKYEGTGSIEILRTYADDDPTTITSAEYQNLLSTIKKFSLMRAYPMEVEESVEKDDDDRPPYLYAWKGLGWVCGKVKIDRAAFVGGKVDEDGFARVAHYNGLPIKVTVVGTVFGRDAEGNDVQLRISDYDGEQCTGVSLDVHLDDPENGGIDEIEFVGQCGLNTNELDFSAASGNDEDTITVSAVTASAGTGNEAGASVEFDSDTQTLGFKFELPKGDSGQEGKSAYEVAVDNGYAGTEEEWLASLKGDKGRSITSVSKTSSSGLTDTYTIAYDDGTTSTFQVANGKDADEVSIGSNGDWYVGETDTGVSAVPRDPDNPVSVASIEKTSSDGLVDTYTVAYSNGSTSAFQVTNGSNGLTPYNAWATEEQYSASTCDLSFDSAKEYYYIGTSDPASSQPTSFADYHWSLFRKDGDTPYIGSNGNWWIGNTDTGIKAHGEDAEPWTIKKTYSTKQAMCADSSTDVAVGEYCIIQTEDETDEDYGKVFMRTAVGACDYSETDSEIANWSFIVDMSVAGVKGEDAHLWVAYSALENHSDFETCLASSAKWLGTSTDATKPTAASGYTWVLIQADPIQPTSSYVYDYWADTLTENSDGSYDATNLSTTKTDTAKWHGHLVTEEASQPTDLSLYDWTCLESPSYWAYADDESGTNFSISYYEGYKYIGFFTGTYEELQEKWAAGTLAYSDYSWHKANPTTITDISETSTGTDSNGRATHTYTITLSDGSTSTFTTTDGKNGTDATASQVVIRMSVQLTLLEASAVQSAYTGLSNYTPSYNPATKPSVRVYFDLPLIGVGQGAEADALLEYATKMTYTEQSNSQVDIRDAFFAYLMSKAVDGSLWATADPTYFTGATISIYQGPNSETELELAAVYIGAGEGDLWLTRWKSLTTGAILGYALAAASKWEFINGLLS